MRTLFLINRIEVKAWPYDHVGDASTIHQVEVTVLN
mgnify:CR=1 FL=1